MLQDFAERIDARNLLYELACGKHQSCPFDEKLIEEAVQAIKESFMSSATRLDLDHVPSGQPFRLALIEEFLRISGDPDYRAFYSASSSFAKGVSIGVDQKLPRTPAVFRKKVKQRDYSGEQEPDEELRSNYPSAEANGEVLEKQFQEEAERGAMVKLAWGEAVAKYGSRLRVASLGALPKGEGVYRVIHDGTHGTGVNGRIRVRDQLECPTAGDLGQAVEELERPTFVLATDVSRAHRLVKVKEDEWGLQACKTSRSAKHVWVNTVGTFGVASIAVHWSRLLGGLQRAVYYMLGSRAVFILAY